MPEIDAVGMLAQIIERLDQPRPDAGSGKGNLGGLKQNQTKSEVIQSGNERRDIKGMIEPEISRRRNKQETKPDPAEPGAPEDNKALAMIGVEVS